MGHCRKFKVEERIESDHLPIGIYLKSDGREKFVEATGEGGFLVKTIEIWNEDSIAEFKEKTSNLNIVEKEIDTVEKRWDDIKRII